jgi:hypothetical protein
MWNSIFTILYILCSFNKICLRKWLSTLKGLSHQIRFAWKWYVSLGLGKDMWRWAFKILKLSLKFCIVCWSSYATHTKHLPLYFFLGSRQVLLQAGLEFSFSSYQL